MKTEAIWSESYLPFSEDHGQSCNENSNTNLYYCSFVQKHKNVCLPRSFPATVVKRALDLELKATDPALDILLTGHGTSLNLSVLIIKMEGSNIYLEALLWKSNAIYVKPVDKVVQYRYKYLLLHQERIR